MSYLKWDYYIRDNGVAWLEKRRGKTNKHRIQSGLVEQNSRVYLNLIEDEDKNRAAAQVSYVR